MGSAWSGLRTMYPPATKFHLEDIPDLSGKVIIVTGGNAGIGKETVKALLAHNAKVYIASRNEQKVAKAIQELKEQTGKEALFLKLDLADLNSIKDAALSFQKNETRLDVLFNNGGVYASPVQYLTEQGYDLQFGTNTLGHFYFTKCLIPMLLSTSESSPDGRVRVVNTSSHWHAHAKYPLDFNCFTDTPARRKMSSVNLYAQSKFGNVLFSNELARRYGDKGIVSISVHPGTIRTEGITKHSSWAEKMLVNLFFQPVHLGALTQLYAGTSFEAENMNGQYLIPWARFGKARSEANDTELGRELWAWFEEQVENI